MHDIYSSTAAETGFGVGMYEGVELDGKAITDKDGKVNFLVKLISLTELVIGEEIDVKPTKIVAGQEADKTNYFLQCMFKAATSGIDTTPHVRQVLGLGDDEEGAGEDAGDDGQAEAEAAAMAEAQAQEEAE